MCSNAEGKTTVRIRHCPLKYAGMAELVDASHLGCDVERRVGSSPSTRTTKMKGIKNMPLRTIKLPMLSDRDLINLYYDDKVAIENIRNSMGCNESWYDKHYAISRTFTKEQVNAMSDNELANLLKLAEKIQEALY